MTGVTNAEIRPVPSEEDERTILAALEAGDGPAPELGDWARIALEEGVDP